MRKGLRYRDMFSRHLNLDSPLTPQESLENLKHLLLDESVKYTSDKNSLVTTSIPLPLLSIDPKLYSKRNRIGINPFVFISGLGVTFESCSDSCCRAKVTLDQRRTITIYVAILCLASSIAIGIDLWTIKLCFVVAIAAMLGGILFDFIVPGLIREEIEKAFRRET